MTEFKSIKENIENILIKKESKKCNENCDHEYECTPDNSHDEIELAQIVSHDFCSFINSLHVRVKEVITELNNLRIRLDGFEQLVNNRLDQIDFGINLPNKIEVSASKVGNAKRRIVRK